MAATRSDLEMNAMTNPEPDMDLELYLLSWNYYPSIGYFCTLSDKKCQENFKMWGIGTSCHHLQSDH